MKSYFKLFLLLFYTNFCCVYYQYFIWIIIKLEKKEKILKIATKKKYLIYFTLKDLILKLS